MVSHAVHNFTLATTLKHIATYVQKRCAGQGSGNIIEAQWSCDGKELKLINCTMNMAECNHKRDAGVYCSGW